MVPSNLKDLKTSLETYYQDMHGQMREDDAFYYQDESVVQISIPNNIPIHMPSTAANIVDNMRDQIVTDAPVIEFVPKTKTKENEEKRVRMVKWAEKQLEYARNWAETDAIDQWKHDLLLRGAAAGKILVQDSGDVVQSHYVFRPLDPLNVYPSPNSNHPLTYVLEVQTRTVADVMAAYPDFEDPRGTELKRKGDRRADDLTREVEWLEYWDAENYIVEVDGQRIKEDPNPYGFVPYIFEYSGLGRSHANGDPKTKARGLITPIHGELQAEVRIKTAWDAQWQFHVFPVLMTKTNSRLVQKMLEVGPGGILEWGPLGEKPEWLEREAPNAQMIGFLDRINGALARQSAPILSNPGQGSGSEFGILEAMRIGQALKVISPVLKTLNRMGSQAINIMAKLAQKKSLDFEIESSRDSLVTLKGEDFDTFTFNVDFESIEPAENDRRILVGQGLVDRGIISKRTFLKKYGKNVVEDPEAEQEEIMLEALVQQAISTGYLFNAAMQGIEADTAAAQAEEGARRVAGGITGAGGEIATEALGLPPQGASRTEGRQTLSEQGVG